MSYLVLARKYRPRDFDTLVGQEHVVQALANALTQQRLHHAYLFTGTRGVGKTTVSRILAKSLNCTGPDGQGGITAHPCGRCDACREIDAGRFIDYVELDAASNRGVDEISQLLDQAVYKPVVGRFKVYMVDEVHMLSTHAFNAMLKTLEEPPEYLKFVLATTDPQKVPPTVLSRCLQFNLRPIPPQTVQAHLAAVLEQESLPAEPGALRLIARAARGSMRDALSLADQAIAFGAGTLAEEGVRQMLGAVDRGHAVRLVDALAAGDGAAVIAAVDALRALGLSAAGTLEEMAALLQQMAVLQAVPDAADAADPETPTVRRLAGRLEADETQLLYSIVLHGRPELGLAPDEYSGLVMVLLRMLAFRPGGPAVRRAQGGDALAPVATVAEPSGAVATSRVGSTAPARASPVRADGPLAADDPSMHAPRTNAAVPKSTPTSVVPGAATSPTRVDPASVGQATVAAASVALSPLAPASAAPPVPARPAEGATPVRTRVDLPEPPPWLDVPDEDEVAAAPAAMPRPELPELPEPPPALSVLPPATPLHRTAVCDRWAGHVRAMVESGGIGAMVRELAMQAECVAVDETAAGDALYRLRVEREMLRAPALVEKLQAALAAALGRGVRVETEAGSADDSPARRDAAERDRRQREAEQIIHDDPLVRLLMAQFATARIVPGSVKPH